MFYIVHYSIINNENQQNAQVIYIFSQFLPPTYFGLDYHQGLLLYSNTTMYAFTQGVIVHKYILHDPNFLWYGDN
jgi:hypothetical protein